MKRSVDSTSLQKILDDTNEPDNKVRLVEMGNNPAGLALVNPLRVSKKTHEETRELSEASTTAHTFVDGNARSKLDMIGRQMKNLHELMLEVIAERRQHSDLHNAACNFVKRPGHIYHLYGRPSGQKYFGMLAPDEWNSPHIFLGSYRLETDQSWTPQNQIPTRYDHINYILDILEGRTELQ